MWLASEKCWDPSTATRKERGEEKACSELEQTWRWGVEKPAEKDKGRGIKGERRKENTLGQYYKLI